MASATTTTSNLLQSKIIDRDKGIPNFKFSNNLVNTVTDNNTQEVNYKDKGIHYTSV